MMKIWTRGLLIAMGCLLIAGIISYVYIQSNLEGLVTRIVETPDLTIKENGQYIGSYRVFPVSAKVEVTVRNHRIESISILEHRHGQGSSGELIILKIIEVQSLDVDVISGATYSSQVLKLAVADALK